MARDLWPHDVAIPRKVLLAQRAVERAKEGKAAKPGVFCDGTPICTQFSDHYETAAVERSVPAVAEDPAVADDPADAVMADVVRDTFLPCTVEGIAESVVLEQYRNRPTDRTRRMGLFFPQCERQKVVSVKVYGFVKSCNLLGNGDWKGSVPSASNMSRDTHHAVRSDMSASRAMLWLELESLGCKDAFEPQIEFVRNCRTYAAQLLHGGSTSVEYITLQLRHVVFRKVSLSSSHEYSCPHQTYPLPISSSRPNPTRSLAPCN